MTLQLVVTTDLLFIFLRIYLGFIISFPVIYIYLLFVYLFHYTVYLMSIYSMGIFFFYFSFFTTSLFVLFNATAESVNYSVFLKNLETHFCNLTCKKNFVKRIENLPQHLSEKLIGDNLSIINIALKT